MPKGPRYRHDARKYIAQALKTMLENLDKQLEITDHVTGILDTVEEHRKMDEDFAMKSTEEELAKSLEDSRDQSIAEIGHIQRRIDEVKQLKAAFESSKSPSIEVIEKTYWALFDSIVFEAVRRHGMLLEPDKSTWSAERLAEDKREKYNIYMYSQALMLGFGVMPQMCWYRFPFDRH